MIYCFSEICRLWVCSSWSTDNEYQGLTVISGRQMMLLSMLGQLKRGDPPTINSNLLSGEIGWTVGV